MPDTPDSLKVKQREVNHGELTYQNSNSYTNPFSKVTTLYEGNVGRQVVKGWQVTASEGHPFNRVNGYDGSDVGGPFETTKRYFARDRWGEIPIRFGEHFLPKWNLVKEMNATDHLIYNGNLLPSPAVLYGYPEPAPSSNWELMAKGTTAIARVKPTNSIADLSVSLAELYREGLPKFPGRSQWESRAQIARGAGSEYLNTQFGWLPLVSEIKNLATVVRDGDKIWRQYVRDSGRLVRRRYEFPDVISSSILKEESGVFPYPSPSSYFFENNSAGGELTVMRHKRQRTWFSGAFTYYLPKEEEGIVGRFTEASAKARKLYGLTLDPEVLWNLTPWSWATDWFANTGDLISNLSDFATDGLLLRYGYMMEETIVSDEYTLSGLKWACNPAGPSSITCSVVTKTLKRVKATPYGFGLTFEDFSPRQIAIMAALGITLR